MSPAPGRKHQGIVGEVFRKTADYLDDKPCAVYVAPFDVRLADKPGAPEEEIINVVQPDVSVYCREDTFASRVLDGFTLEVDFSK